MPPAAWHSEEAHKLLAVRDVGALFRLAQRFGISQGRLSAATSIPQGRISEILHGKRQVTSLELFERIANGLDMPDDCRMLLGLAPTKPPTGGAEIGPLAEVGLLAAYPRRADVPAELWWQLFTHARAHLDILVYAGIFLHEQYPDFNALLTEKARAGCKLRVALGDPDSEQVRERGQEERYGHGIETRCRVALLHYRPLFDLPGVEINLHRTTLYNSIYRADDEMLVNAHVWGHNAYSAPVMHLRRMPGPCLFTAYAASFDGVWATSTPVVSEDR